MKRLVAVAFVLSYAVPAAAQCPPVCIDPKTGQVIIAPPPVHVEPPPVHVDPPPIHVNPPPYQPPPVVIDPQIEASRIARWKFYFDWEAKIRADVDLKIDAEVHAQARVAAQGTADTWAYRPLAGYGRNPDVAVNYPVFDMGLFGWCAAPFNGPGRPAYWGFCMQYGLRLNPDLAIRLDPAFVWESHSDIDFHSFGLSPSVTYSFAHGRGGGAASHAYVIGGVDGWLPIDGGRASPDAFGGFHAGVGAQGVSGAVGISAELRALGRAGFGPSDEHMGRFRFGVEARVYVLSFSFY